MRFRHRLSVVAFLLLALIFCGSARAQDIQVIYTPPFVEIVGGVNFTAWSGGQSQVFVFALTPQSAVNLYLTNKGGAGHAITVTTFSAGDPNVSDFTNNQSQWTPFSTVNIATGASGNIQTQTINANSTLVLSSGISNAGKFAVKLSGAGASADTLTMTAVLTPNGITGITQVTGTKQMNTPSGCPSCSPVLIAGLDGSLNVLVPNVAAAGAGGNVGWNIATVKGSVAAISAQASVENLGSAGTDGPLAVEQVNNSSVATHISTATTTAIGGAHTEVRRIICGTAVAASTVTIQDGGTTRGIFTCTLPFDYEIALNCQSGCSIITNQATDVMVISQ